ncbi:MAG: AmmeMemoRadiSam system radical SAM enzyme [Desulfomicrobium apsheronum]|nr:AmmeMemoRadiSam system radical SAM enzyme [Desulfomicrobium apsheronum]
MKTPALLWRSLEGSTVQCQLCAHFCRIEDGTRGQCGVRENRGGQLFSLSYDKVAALNLDPVEKKPLFHFLPGTKTLSLGTQGCNLACAFCQNASLSQPPRQGKALGGEAIPPREIIRMAQTSGAASVAYTYSEPTIFFELMRETAILAREAGLANIMVSNGFQSPQCLDALGDLIQAVNIDIKSFREEFYNDICAARLGPVLKNLVHMKKLGWHIETTTLIIPDLNDSDRELGEIARFVHDELGKDTAWHVSRFHPCHQMLDHAPTPLDTLKRAYDIGRAAGLSHVFVGNVPGSDLENTICPGCGQMVVERVGFTILRNRLQRGVCPGCGEVVIRPENLGKGD